MKKKQHSIQSRMSSRWAQRGFVTIDNMMVVSCHNIKPLFRFSYYLTWQEPTFRFSFEFAPMKTKQGFLFTDILLIGI